MRLKEKWEYFKLMNNPIRSIRCKLSDMKIKRMINKNIKAGYIAEDGTPLKCHKCGCTEFESEDVDWIEHTICESKEICKKCGTVCGYWAYGYWDWEYMI